MKTLYQTTVHVSGGRDGQFKSQEGSLQGTLTMPKELGGAAVPGATNPEQLFAAGYGACYESAIRFVARGLKITVTESSVDATVKLLAKPDGGFQLAVNLAVNLPGMDREAAQKLVDEAHKVCPYSNATRGNISVEIQLV